MLKTTYNLDKRYYLIHLILSKRNLTDSSKQKGLTDPIVTFDAQDLQTLAIVKSPVFRRIGNDRTAIHHAIKEAPQ